MMGDDPIMADAIGLPSKANVQGNTYDINP